jgi:hypothetical protein
MQLQRSDLRDRGQRFDAVDLHIGCAIALHLDQLEQIRHAGHRMTLEELLPAEAIGRPHQRARPTLEMRQHPRPPTFSK